MSKRQRGNKEAKKPKQARPSPRPAGTPAPATGGIPPGLPRPGK